MNEKKKQTKKAFVEFRYKSRCSISSRDAQRRLVHKKDAISNSGSDPGRSRDAAEGNKSARRKRKRKTPRN